MQLNQLANIIITGESTKLMNTQKHYSKNQIKIKIENYHFYN